MPVTPQSIAQSPSLRFVRAGLGLAWYLLIVMAIVAALYLVAFALTGSIEPGLEGDYRIAHGLGLGSATEVPIEVRYEYSSDPHSDRAIPQAVRDGRQVLVHGHKATRLRLTDGYGAVYNALSVLFALVVGMGVVWQLRELCASIAEGQPFCAANGVRLRRIGFIIIAGSLSYSLAGWVSASRYVGRIDIPDARLIVDASLHIEDLIMGLLLLVLGQLFHLGAQIEAERQALQVEQELTV